MKTIEVIKKYKWDILILLLVFIAFGITLSTGAELKTLKKIKSVKKIVEDPIQITLTSIYWKYFITMLIASVVLFLPRKNYVLITGISNVINKIAKDNIIVFEYLFFGQSMLVLLKVIYFPMFFAVIVGVFSYIFLIFALSTVNVSEDIKHHSIVRRIILMLIVFMFHFLMLTLLVK